MDGTLGIRQREPNRHAVEEPVRLAGRTFKILADEKDKLVIARSHFPWAKERRGGPSVGVGGRCLEQGPFPGRPEPPEFDLNSGCGAAERQI